MNKCIILNGRETKYTIKESTKARRLTISVCCDKEFMVTLPKRVNNRFIEKFIKEKEDWILKTMQSYKNKIILADCSDWRNYKLYKPKAMRLAYEKVPYYNKFYNFKYNKIIIKNQRSRWGSCSIDKNLNFNYRIAFLLEDLSDYIIVHELCHLKEMNHSRNFWHQVSRIFPDYREKARKLRNIIFN